MYDAEIIIALQKKIFMTTLIRAYPLLFREATSWNSIEEFPSA